MLTYLLAHICILCTGLSVCNVSIGSVIYFVQMKELGPTTTVRRKGLSRRCTERTRDVDWEDVALHWLILETGWMGMVIIDLCMGTEDCLQVYSVHMYPVTACSICMRLWYRNIHLDIY
ncbi:uncharacterized protein EURHEDRAFT_344046 [Aspergillus ruber CBS 135680]|uniref:Uncharacterized protein n=1 Tax=Aspergillus ruber (strain CBS 135680) TaxID=1388766 RepID=A0A017SJ47_ASPRC|nr:uncharacterized protein EURHEDRAFT_344046 [Aspergillus ruber CBS 135680]EYE96968.1 hypothetical protein EURHEDRAFT_344046 [Aspergillus ruber CBS 135680]